VHQRGSVYDATVVVEAEAAGTYVLAHAYTPAASVLGTHETLMATTRTNAELLGIGTETGTIEPGKRADLLVVDGDPLADIAVLQHPDNLMAIVQAGQFRKRQL
jgi:imidazolonepropionase-like amidohydrolase